MADHAETLSLTEIAALLGVSVDRVRRKARAGAYGPWVDLPRLGREYRVPRDRVVAAHGLKAAS